MLVILMSTYNGEKYLAEQIDSIINQTYKDWTLFIRDDGSSDSTNTIIDKYIKERSDIHRIATDKKNLGPAKSFMKMLETVEADYYMFSDQDDFWLPEKIERSLQEMKRIEQSHTASPILVHTDLQVVDENLKLVQESFWKQNFSDLFIEKYMPVRNFVTGCSMLFNKAARDLSLSESPYIIMHDYWLAICVWADGGIIYSLHESVIKYRQHGRNVLGAYKSQGSLLERVLKSWNYNKCLFKMVNLRKKISLQKLFWLKVLYMKERKEILKNV